VSEQLAWLVDGVPFGCIWALVAVGLVLTYKTTGVFNLAFSAQAFAAAAFYVVFVQDHGWPRGAAFIVAIFVLSPLVGMFLGFLFFLSAMWIFRRARPEPLDQAFRKVQLVSAAAFSFGHGMNDAQKTMGIIAVLLFSTGYLKTMDIPFWIVLICHAAIGLGTLTGGWRIVRTMGMRITALKPIGGSCAEFAGAVTLIGASLGGIPVSTTHTITGAIMGMGSVRRFSAVRWGVARSIVIAWILTIPASAAVVVLTAMPMLRMLGAAFASRRDPSGILSR